MSAVLAGLLVVAAVVGAPAGFWYWLKAPQGQLLRRTAVLAVVVVAWLALASAVFVEVARDVMGGSG